MRRFRTQHGGVSGPVGRGYAAFAGLGFVALLLGVSTGCSDGGAESKPAPGGESPAVPVMVGKAVEKTVPIQVRVIGNGEAYTTVNVKAQVDGLLQRAYFREGQDVQKGELLFTIDPRPFQAALDQAQANLARDQAQLQNARGQWERNSALYNQGIISKDQYDTFHTNVTALEGTVRADEAMVENAKIQLGYCTIRSPISGRTGSLSIQVGNLVKNNDAALVTINQISPLYVDFAVPEQYLDEIKQRAAAHALRVEAIVPQDLNHPEQGVLSFINNTVDSTTGTVLMKGTFPNTARRLWPGQFVTVVLTLGELRNAVVVPTPAIQTSPNGKYVFVVKSNQTVDLRPVVPGFVSGGDTVIDKGLAAGETVVTDGQLRLVPGAKIEEKNSL
jgi:membrane fusion protein, multidrug efflux system